MSETRHLERYRERLNAARGVFQGLLTWALKGLEQIYRGGYRYKKAGVMLYKLTPAEQLSMRLFGDTRFEKPR